ncbi:ABC-type molybdate transport system substrate-binding protein [Bradyrhizobium sp. USDA 326]
MNLLRSITVVAGLLLACPSAQSAQTNVAVAANFTDAAKEIAALFKQKTGHEAVLSFGASGQFYRSSSRKVSLSRAAASPTRSASSCCGASRRAS